MATSVDVPGGQPDEPPAYLVVDDGCAEHTVAIFDQLFVGRQCTGISEHRRLVIDDPEISRTHLEIRLDSAGDQAFVIDTSSNGTLLNGVRLQRAVPLRIRPDDLIRIGDVALTFRSQRFTATPATTTQRTVARFSQATMVMVVGDIVNYSTISQLTDEHVIASSLHALWRRLGGVLQAHHGTLSHYAGDALFAVWSVDGFPNAAELAIDFALAANRNVEQIASELALRGPGGAPIRMGWGVARGVAALAAMTRSTDTVLGDATNLAFRLAGLAGRDGRSPVLATKAVHDIVAQQFTWGASESVEVKGRVGSETVFPVVGRGIPGTPPAAEPSSPGEEATLESPAAEPSAP